MKCIAAWNNQYVTRGTMPYLYTCSKNKQLVIQPRITKYAMVFRILTDAVKGAMHTS